MGGAEESPPPMSNKCAMRAVQVWRRLGARHFHKVDGRSYWTDGSITHPFPTTYKMFAVCSSAKCCRMNVNSVNVDGHISTNG